jgi:hypothetical protein
MFRRGATGWRRRGDPEPEAIAAVQEFLRFQIREHQTGDAVR